MSEEEKNKFIALYHFLDKPQDFNLEMNYYEFRDELKILLDLYQKEKENNRLLIEGKFREVADKNSYIKDNYISKDKIEKTFDNYSESSLMLNNTFIEFKKDLLGEEYWQY